MTIEEFIKARLDEDEAAATAAAKQDNEGESWRVRKVRENGMYVWGEHQAIPPNGKGERLGLLDDAQTRFVESYDPARALREVTAHRELLEFYAETRRIWKGDYLKADFVLGKLAAIWRKHPDYRPEWNA